MVKRTLISFCLALLSFNSQAANINVHVDRNPVVINESFKIIFEADDSMSDSPDFSPLQQDFEILNRNQSSNMQITNGSISRETRWTLNVIARRSGILSIPSIRIGNDNSPAISITVNEELSNNANNIPSAGTANDLFVEIDISSDSAYVQQQVIYSIRFYLAVSVNGFNMSEPSFIGGDIVVEKLGDDAQFETRRHGRRYLVVERKYALFPQQSGEITLEPISLDAKIAATSRSGFDPFGQNNTTKRLKSNGLTLQVLPIPASMKNKAWLPSNKLKLSESWSEQVDSFIVGEPITRTITLNAEGLTAAQLPSLAITDTPGFKMYPDQPSLNNEQTSNGINGTRQEKIALIPAQAGQQTLPEININWWNTRSNKIETATLPARTVTIKPGDITNQITAPQSPLENTIATSSPQTVLPTMIKEANSIYSTLSIVLGTGWLLTIIAWLSSQRKNKTANTANSNSPKASIKAVKQACLSNNPQQTKSELLKWAAAHWPDNPATNLAEIGNRLDQTTADEITKLNQILYGSTEAAWQGKDLWQHFSNAVKKTAAKHKQKENVLIPLYP